MIENMDFINLFMSTVLIVVLGFQASYTQIAHYGKLKVHTSSIVILIAAGILNESFIGNRNET